MFYQTETARRPPKRPKNSVFSLWWPWPFIFDLDLQTHPSEGRNTSSVWIWRKSVQRFPRYFIHERKSHRHGAKNRTLRSSLRAVISTHLMSQKSQRCHIVAWWHSSLPGDFLDTIIIVFIWREFIDFFSVKHQFFLQRQEDFCRCSCTRRIILIRCRTAPERHGAPRPTRPYWVWSSTVLMSQYHPASFTVCQRKEN